MDFQEIHFLVRVALRTTKRSDESLNIMRMKLAFVAWLFVAGSAAAQTVAPPVAQPAQRPAATAAPVAAPKAPHLGPWLTEGAKSRVEVTDCGPTICAKIVWLKDPNDDAGKPLRDGNNKSATLRSRPILGLPLFENMRPAKSGWEGRVYNPEEGEWYDVTVWLVGDKLNIKGCVLFVCETHPWTRAPAVAAAPAPQAAPAKRTQ
jgi:uncharacterized protein (DUF2147 family)